MIVADSGIADALRNLVGFARTRMRQKISPCIDNSRVGNQRQCISSPRCFVTAVVLGLFGVSPVLAADSPLAYEFESVPRFEVWQGERAVMREVYTRLAFDASKQLGSTLLRARTEGFVSYDIAEEDRRPIGNPDLRKSRNESDLNELWFDATFESIGIRVGRQPIRWSQSWTLPSLDIFTGRRSNRLFLDPLIDQLTHPDAVRLTKSIQLAERTIEVEAVRIIQSAPNRYAEPIGNQDRIDNDVFGAKASTRFGSLDIGFVFSSTDKGAAKGSTAGLFGSYAFEKVVAKFEAGEATRNARFAMLGFDWFLDSLMIGPQVTVFTDPLLSNRDGIALAYLPVLYSENRWTFEFDWLQSFGAPDAARNRFSSLRIGREVAEALILSFAVQDYRGDALGLLGQGERLTGGTIYGMRLEYTGGWAK